MYHSRIYTQKKKPPYSHPLYIRVHLASARSALLHTYIHACEKKRRPSCQAKRKALLCEKATRAVYVTLYALRVLAANGDIGSCFLFARLCLFSFFFNNRIRRGFSASRDRDNARARVLGSYSGNPILDFRACEFSIRGEKEAARM